MKKLPGLLFCLTLLALIGSADANPYGYAYYRTVTIDHTKVGVGTINGFGHNRTITIDHNKVGAVNGTDQTNFPVLIYGTYNGSGGTFDVRTVANLGPIQNTTTLNGNTVPADLIFTSDAGCTTKLNWEVASYNGTSGAIEVWVQIPTLSHSSDTVIYVCYGGAAITTYQGNATATWDSSFKAVYHLNNNAANTTVTESTGNANTGANSTNTSNSTTGGEITTGFDYKGTSGTVGSHISAFDNGTQLTISLWLNPNNLANAKYLVAQADGNFTSFWRFAIDSTFVDAVELNEGSGIICESARVLSAGSWQYVTVTYNGSSGYTNRCRMYYSGSSITVTNDGMLGTLNANTYGISLGEDSTATGSTKFDGKLDEVQISSTVRSADWINTSYKNQSSPSTFYTLGSQGSSTPSDQSNFPVLISGTYAYLATGAHNGQIQKTATLNGQTVPVDLIFTSDAAGAHLLNWEVASYDSTAGTIEVWVNIPTLSHSIDTVIYMWYNNANIAASYLGSATSTWDSNFKLVYHLPDGTTFSAKDSTSNTNHGTNTGVAATTGEIDGGGNLVGNQYIVTPITTVFTAFTVCVWFKSSDNTAAQRLVDKSYSGGFWMGHETTGAANQWGGGVHEASPPYGIYVTLANGSWHQLCSVLSGSAHYIYGDGGAVSTSNSPASVSIDSSTLYIGEVTGGGGIGFNGQIDEVEISDIARSLDWIATEYQNQSLPSAFYAVGSQVSVITHTKGFFN